jgi:uncharacterized membrane protein YheB (UPF0754 family)
MYQAEDKIEYLEKAHDISQWAEVLFGYFVKSNRSDEEKVQLVQAFADELSNLPSNSLRFIDKAKAKWIEEANQRPPSIPQFLQMLREFNNRELNNAPKLENKDDSIYGRTAYAWDNAMDKLKFIDNFRKHQASPATKWVMREWMRDNKFSEKRISLILGRPF